MLIFPIEQTLLLQKTIITVLLRDLRMVYLQL